MIFADPNFLFPEIWFRDVSIMVPAEYSSDGICYATGFATAHYAERISSMSETEVYLQLVLQLESVFSLLSPHHFAPGAALELPKPSAVYVSGMIQHWSPQQHPFIGGGYCSSKAGHPVDYGVKLAEPVNDVLFFCGEATNVGAGATAHAALESGMRAAAQVAEALRDRNSEEPEQKKTKSSMPTDSTYSVALTAASVGVIATIAYLIWNRIKIKN
jgi:hypothetical protein